jgi:prepilin-type N-terminal cleavage/methylation domain-containing protein
MLSIRKKFNRGFTIVELLIVIVVIGILATLVVTTYSGIQQKTRDTARKTDINALHGQIEAYQAQNGKYPTLANINDSDFRTANLKGLDPAALQDPQGTATTLAGAPAADVYSYVATPANCDNDPAGVGDCTGYTLTATLEGGGTYTKTALN